MKLTALLDALADSTGQVTETDLARRLGTSAGNVSAMLDALRASGRLGPELGAATPADPCASSGSCSLRCPGPGDCPLFIDLEVRGLQVRSPSVT